MTRTGHAQEYPTGVSSTDRGTAQKPPTPCTQIELGSIDGHSDRRASNPIGGISHYWFFSIGMLHRSSRIAMQSPYACQASTLEPR
jgi:hypothetical protein